MFKHLKPGETAEQGEENGRNENGYYLDAALKFIHGFSPA